MGSKLRDINYEIKEFPVEWVEGKIKVRGGRTELANPVSLSSFSLSFPVDLCVCLSDSLRLWGH